MSYSRYPTHLARAARRGYRNASRRQGHGRPPRPFHGYANTRQTVLAVAIIVAIAIVMALIGGNAGCV